MICALNRFRSADAGRLVIQPWTALSFGMRERLSLVPSLEVGMLRISRSFTSIRRRNRSLYSRWGDFQVIKPYPKNDQHYKALHHDDRTGNFHDTRHPFGRGEFGVVVLSTLETKQCTSFIPHLLLRTLQE